MKNPKDDSGLAYPAFSNSGHPNHPGLTKRELFAMAAMQGLCAKPEHAGTPGNELCKYSVNIADALLEELAK